MNVTVIIIKGHVAGIRYLETLSLPLANFVPQWLGWWPLSRDKGVTELLLGGVVE